MRKGPPFLWFHKSATWARGGHGQIKMQIVSSDAPALPAFRPRSDTKHPGEPGQVTSPVCASVSRAQASKNKTQGGKKRFFKSDAFRAGTRWAEPTPTALGSEHPSASSSGDPAPLTTRTRPLSSPGTAEDAGAHSRAETPGRGAGPRWHFSPTTCPPGQSPKMPLDRA